jgi:hypothetical protein
MGKNLSDFWRLDRSDDQVTELVSVLKGADTIISAGTEGFSVDWAAPGETSQIHIREKRILLSAQALDNLSSPIPGRAVDVIIGLGLHEKAHSEWSDPNPYFANKEHEEVYRILEDAFIEQMKSRESLAAAEYIKRARDFYLSDKAKKYIDELALLDEPGYYDVCGVWMASVLNQYDPPKMSAKMQEIQSWLLQKTIECFTAGKKKGKRGIDARSKIVAEIYGRLLGSFPPTKTPKQPDLGEKEDGTNQKPSENSESEKKQDDKESNSDKDEKDTSVSENKESEAEQDVPDNEEKQDSTSGNEEDISDGEPSEDKDGESSEGESESDAESGSEEADSEQELTDEEIDQQIRNNITGGKEPGHPSDLVELWDKASKQPKPLPQDLTEEIADAMKFERQDIKGDLAKLGIYTDAAKIKNAEYSLDDYNKIRPKVESEIGKTVSAIQLKEREAFSYTPGHYSGKLDKRRLWKAGAGKQDVFRRRTENEKPSAAIVFIMDVSGSMSPYMNTVAESAVVFAESAARKENTYFEVLAYTSGWSRQGNRVSMTRMASPQLGKICLSKIDSGGGTPSGPAIGTAILELKDRPEQDKIIIHFTDGAPDDADQVRKAISVAAQKNIRVICIASGNINQRYLDMQYGKDNWEVIKIVPELPQAMGKLTRRLLVQ